MIIAAHLTILLAAAALAGAAASPLDPLPWREAAGEMMRRTYDVAVSGRHAFAATGAGLAVYDIGDAAREGAFPRQVAAMLFPGSANAIHVADGRAFLSLGPEGLRIVDISDPASPRFVSGIDTAGSVNAAVPIGPDRVILADGVMGLTVVDISGIASPRVVESLDTGGYAWHLAASGGLVAVAEEEGVRFLRVGGDGTPREVSFLPLPGGARGVCLGDRGRCYVASGAAGFSVVDASDPSAPRIVATMPSADHTRGVACAGDLVFLAESTAGLRILEDRGDDRAPSERGALRTARANRVTVSGRVAVVAEDAAGIRLIDVSEPSRPREATAQRF